LNHIHQLNLTKNFFDIRSNIDQQFQFEDNKLNLYLNFETIKVHSKIHDNQFEFLKQVDLILNEPFVNS